MQVTNFVPVLAGELRHRGARNIVSIFYNEDVENISVFMRNHPKMGSKSFNYTPDFSMNIEDMCDDIIDIANRVERGWLGYWLFRLLGI